MEWFPIVRLTKTRLLGARQGIAAAARRAVCGLISLLVIAVSGEAYAGGNIYVWDGGANNGNWGSAANWDVTPTWDNQANLQFAGSVQTSATNNITTTIRNMTFNAGAGAFTISGSAVSVGNAAGFVNSSSNLQTINLAGITLTANTNFNAGAAGMSISSPISGAFNFLIPATSTGTLSLSGSNSFTGAVTMSAGAGALRISSSNALGTTAGGVTITTGGALELTNNITVGAEALSLIGTGISSGGAVRNISGTNTYGGLITLAGAARINSDAGLLRLDVATGNAIAGTADNLTFGGAGNIEVNDGITNTTATLTKDGAGTLTLAASNTYSGLTTISNGWIRVTTSTNALGQGTLTIGGGNLEIANDTPLALNRNTTLTASGTIRSDRTSAGAGVTHTLGTLSIGAQTLTLDTDATTVTSGTAGLTFGAVTLSAAGATFNPAANTLLTLGAISGNTFGFTVGGAGNTNITGIIGTTTGGLTKTGNGTLTLSATNTYSGTTTIQSGTISVGTVLAGAVSQPLGTNARLNLGLAGTSSGRLLYTGGSGTLSKNVFALGNGTDTIQNAGSGLLTLSGTLTKNGTILRLQGGAQGITVTGSIVGALANSDLAVQFGLTTLSALNTYTGPTFVNSSGTLALGISNAIPSNSAVTLGGSDAGGDGGIGVLSMGSFTNAIGSLAFSGSGGTIRMAPTASATSTVVLSATGAITLTGTSTLDLTGMATGAGLYRLIGGSSLTGTFATVTGLASNYLIRYGTVNANEVDAQFRANQATTFTMTTGAVTRALVNTNVAVSGTITNSSPVNSTALALGLASTGLTGSGFTTGNVTAGSSTAVSGTLATGSTAGTQNWSITNTDAASITTTSTATGSLTVVNQRTFSVSPATVALGRYLITNAVPTGTTGVTSLGLSATTANASLGSFSSSNGYTLSLASGSTNFAGASESQTAGYTLTGSATLAGLLSGSFSSTVTAELGSIDPVVINYTANPVNQRTFTTSTATLALGFVHAGGSSSTPTLTVTSTGLNATTADATLGSFTGGPAGFSLGLTSGTNVFAGASSPQSTTYTLSGTGSTLGAISGTYSSPVAAEFGSIPNVTVAVTGQVYSGQSTWATNGGGNWGTFASGFGANWGTNEGSPGLDAAFTNVDTATFGSALTGGTAAINTNGANISLASLTFNNAAGAYEIYQTGGSGAMTLVAAGTNSAGITVTAGSHAIHADLTLGSDLIVDISAGAAITFHNAVAGSAGSDLTKTGLGTLFINGNSTYAGDTTISQGTVSLLSGVNPLGLGTVTVASGATLDFNNRDISNVLNVLPGGILLNTGSGQVSDVSTLVIFTGTSNGAVNVLTGGTASFESTVGALVTVNAGGVADFTSLSSGLPSVNVLGGGLVTVAGTAAGSYQVAGTGTFSGSLTGNLDVSNGGVVAFNGSNSSGATFNVDAGGLATVGSSATIGGQLHVSGSAIIAGTVTSAADVLVEAGGSVTLVDGASFGQTALGNSGLLVIDNAAPLSLATGISGTGSLTKVSAGLLTLTGTSTFTGGTIVEAGQMNVVGSLGSDTSVLAGGTVGGTGSIGGTLSGAGLVSPGDSGVGILTAGVFDGSTGLNAAFEFTSSAPNYAVTGTGALNDVLRLTNADPFASAALNATNVIDIYLNAGSVNYLDEFEGGFYAEQLSPAQLLAAVGNATYVGWLRTDGAGVRTFNGFNYVPIATDEFLQRVRVETKEGPTPGSSVTVFVAVPEPATIVLGVTSLLSVLGLSTLRRRIARSRLISSASHPVR